MQQILLKIRYFERGLSKTFKKVNFIFFSNPIPFNGQCYQKQKESGIAWHHKLFHFHFSFESRKCRKEEEKLQKFEYLKNEKSFLDEMTNIFQFLTGYHLVKKI